MNLADWLDATARARPDAPAIFEGTQLYATYAAFATKVRMLAAGMRAGHGIAKGDRVATFMQNCPAFIRVRSKRSLRGIRPF